MKAQVKLNDKITFEVEADTEKSMFQEIARAQEIFTHNECGRCKCKEVKFVSRKDPDDNDWLEVVCQDMSCRAKVIFGVAKKGGVIYPKIKWDQLSEKQQEQRADEKQYADQHYGYLPNNGWFQFKYKEAE